MAMPTASCTPDAVAPMTKSFHHGMVSRWNSWRRIVAMVRATYQATASRPAWISKRRETKRSQSTMLRPGPLCRSVLICHPVPAAASCDDAASSR